MKLAYLRFRIFYILHSVSTDNVTGVDHFSPCSSAVTSPDRC